MLSHKRQTAQLKDDLRRYADNLITSAGNFKNAIESIEQVLSKLTDSCYSPAHDGLLIGARPVSESQRLLTAKEIAAYLGVSDRSIYLWVKQRNFPYRKVGDDLRFDLKEVEAWTTPETKTLEKAPLRVVE